MESTEKKSRGKRGQGCVYRPSGSRNWWIKFSVAGRVVQESANTESRREALDALKGKILKYSSGEAVDCRTTTVASLKESMISAWKLHGRGPRSIKWAEGCWKHLLEFFGTMKASAVSSAAIRDYMEFRKGQKASNASINRELSIMQSAFSMGFRETPRRVAAKLYFDRLPESKGRQGFVEEKTYRAIADNCKDLYLRSMLALAYSFGFRRGELLTLKVSDCDLLGGTIRLRTSKNGEPRTVPLTAETRGLLAACISGKDAEEPVFTRNGKAVSDFRGSWDAATTKAGCPGLLFHDLRRSAVRNMVRGGIPEVVCMKISGHKTRAVFDRYNIVSGRDLADAAEKIESAQLSYRQAKVAKRVEETANAESVTLQ
ncbi:MAG: tyrosine-type recombinase/integrase [Candidatus Acidiferrales bacterium]